MCSKKKIEKKFLSKIKSIKSIKMSSSMSMSMSNQPLEKVEPNVESNVESNVSMEVLAPPLSKVESKVESKVVSVSVRLSKLDLEVLSKKYNFEVEEALRYLKEEKTEKSKKSKDLSPPLAKVEKCVYPMPFNGEKKEGCCNGIVKNHGLYTQCTKKVKGEYCKVCEEKPYGTIDDRLKVDLYEYKDPKGNGPKRYTEVLKKLKISKENVKEEAKRLNITISPIHLEEVVEQVKRGRPKTEKKVKEATGKKGRPKKEKKQVEVNNAEEEEDLFATLIANANAKLEIANAELEIANAELDQPLEKVQSNEEVIVEESTDSAPPVVEKVEKKAKKVKEADPAKEAEKQKKAEEKAAKEAEKLKKAEEKTAKEAQKLKKAEEKTPKVVKKKSKDLVPPLPKVEEEADVVRKFEHEGKSYYKSKNSGVIYNMEQEVVGKWNEERNDIDFEEEEEEEEYDD